MTRTEFPEEVTTLLGGQLRGRRGRRSSARAGARRRRRLRVLMGGAALLGLVVGCVVAIDAAVMRTQAQMNAVEGVEPEDVGYEATRTAELSTQLGWGSFTQAWCAMHAAVVKSAYCTFASDKQACQDETNAECGADNDKDDEGGEASTAGVGDGSGSF